MGIKKVKPTSPARRFVSYSTYDEITTDTPEKSLVISLKKSSGRNHHGHITSRHRGGGARKLYRVIDFKRNKFEVPGTVKTIEYDPNRSPFIALIAYKDGEKRYILAPNGLKVDDTIISSAGAVDMKPGNATALKNLPLGTNVHNIEMNVGAGGIMVRSAVTSAQLVALEGKMAFLKMPSGELRKVNSNCMATIGVVSNSDHSNISIGNAGRKRHLGRRPKVRGVVMNPVDHPHGGGEGKAPAGNPHPVSPWGQLAKGLKTRKKKKPSSKLIVSRRKKK